MPPQITVPHQNGSFVTTDEPTLTVITQSPLGVTLDVVHSVGFEKNIMPRIPLYSIIQSSFSA